jgi:hypothetical protein
VQDCHEVECDSPKPKITLTGKTALATKHRDLSSDILGTGNTFLKYQGQDVGSTLIDFDLKALPPNIKEDEIKKIAGVKHVISVKLDHDAIRNTNLGTGRIKIRLGANEDAEKVMLQFLKEGYGVKEHTHNPQIKSKFTTE